MIFKKFEISKNENGHPRNKFIASQKYQPRRTFFNPSTQCGFNSVLGKLRNDSNGKLSYLRQKKKSAPIPIWRQKPPENKDKGEWKEKIYKKYLDHICETNGITVSREKSKDFKLIYDIDQEFKEKPTTHTFKYFVGFGNNSTLVQKALKQRFWWAAG